MSLLTNLLALTFSTAWLASQCCFNVPAGEKSFGDRALMNACYASPLCLGFCLPSEREQAIRPRVAHLCDTRHPAAIFFAIVRIVINAIKRVSVWAITHIVMKVLKLTPSLTYFHASTTVVGIGLVRWICASLKHCKPRDKERRSTHTVSDITRRDFLVRATSAFYGDAIAKVAAAAFLNCTTCTAASPHGLSATIGSAFKHRPISKSDKRKILKFWHMDKLPIVNAEVNTEVFKLAS